VAAIKTLTNRINLLDKRARKAGKIYFLSPGESLPPGISSEDKIILWSGDNSGPKINAPSKRK